MSGLVEALSEAAERGVAVTIITNARETPALRFRWRFEEKWWGAIGTFSAAGFEAKVYDKDGDASEWVLRRGKTVVAEGEDWGWKPFYHFDACLLAAETAMLAAVRQRLADIRARAA